MSQLSLFDEPGPALTPEQERIVRERAPRIPSGSTPTGSAPPFKQSERDALMEALRRDLDTLAGPPKVKWPCPAVDRPLYEERIAYYRARLQSVVD